MAGLKTLRCRRHTAKRLRSSRPKLLLHTDPPTLEPLAAPLLFEVLIPIVIALCLLE